MRNLLIMFLLVTFINGCNESAVVNGKDVPCIGIERKGEDPRYVYKIDTKNVILAVIFSELMFIPPIIVLLDELYCPIALKEPHKEP